MSLKKIWNLRWSVAIGMAVIGMSLSGSICNAMPADTRALLTKIYAARPINPTDLKVRIQMGQIRVGLSDKLDFDVLLENVSATPFYVYGDLQAGETGSFSVWFTRTDSHQAVSSRVIYDAVRSSDVSKEDFVEIPSRYIYGTHVLIDVSDFNFPGPGLYEMVVVYHAPYSSKFINGLRIWGKECGDVSSDPIQVQITK